MLNKLSFCLFSDCDDDYDDYGRGEDDDEDYGRAEDEDDSCWRYIATAPELCHKIHDCRFRSPR